ncbi:hypothetical protein [Profundibacter sp.]
MRGLIMIDRALLDHHIVGMKNPLRLAAWLWMLSKARYKQGKFFLNGETINLDRGEFVCSRSYMSEETGMTPKQIRVFLSGLEVDGMVSKRVQGRGQGVTILTICNYEIYQDYESYRAKARANEGPSRGQAGAKQGPNSVTPEETPDETPEETPELFPVEKSPDKPKPKRATALPENWVPNDANVAHALGKNLTHEDIANEAGKFRDHHLAKGTTFKDWNAGWRKWVGNSIKFNGTGNGRGMGRGATPSEIADRGAQWAASRAARG